MEDWRKWKNHTQCMLKGSGFEGILTDGAYALRNSRLNRVVHSQLLVATSSGTAYHIVKQHDTEKDGNVA
eukprot:4055057-Ditylum_brightwellii.AAC.1